MCGEISYIVKRFSGCFADYGRYHHDQRILAMEYQLMWKSYGLYHIKAMGD